MPDRPAAHTDVLIVGAGPAGLTLSVTLAQLSHRPRRNRSETRGGPRIEGERSSKERTQQ